MAIRVATSDNLTTYEVGVPVLLWRPRIRRPPMDGRLFSLADRSERLVGVPLLGRLGWLGAFIYVVVVALMALLLPVLLVLEWVASVVLSFLLLVFKVATRRRFPIRASLVGYVGAHKPQDGRVSVGPPDRPIERPVRVEWSRGTLSAARRDRQEMADHIRVGQFTDLNG